MEEAELVAAIETVYTDVSSQITGSLSSGVVCGQASSAHRTRLQFLCVEPAQG